MNHKNCTNIPKTPKPTGGPVDKEEIRNEELGVRNEIKQCVKFYATSSNNNHSSLLTSHFSFFLALFFALCSLLFVACDLFTGPQVDIFQQISDEVDWANADKLTVKVDFPSTWGVSPQFGTDKCFDNAHTNENPRKGYEFKVEFTPDTAYTLTAWLAFRTSDLPSNWLDDTTLIAAENIQSLGPGEVTLPEPSAGGGTFNFKVHTTDPVTLVPWCQTQPRITRTEPRNRPNPTDQPYARATDIVLYFNGALNTSTVKFAADVDEDGIADGDGIWITSTKGGNVKNNTTEQWYNAPEYSTAGGFFTVTMTVGTLPPEGSLMTVKVNGIKNAQGESMDGDYSFSWNTSSATSVSLTSYGATYNSGNITVTYTTENAEDVVTYYRLNKGANTPFNGTISGVPVPEAGNVTNGTPVSGIREYEIVIELYVDKTMELRETFKIWNIPGMSVSKENPLIEINTSADIIAISTPIPLPEISNPLYGLGSTYANKQYILTNSNITLSGWTPIGDNANSFQGKFYGNGHTITITGMNAAAEMGLFGVVQGASSDNPAIVRDLTVNYNNVSVTRTAETRFGGIAGRFNEHTRMTNTIVSGKFGITATNASNNHIRAGQMIGDISYSTTNAIAEINNVYANLELTVENQSANGNIFAGGIVGDVLNTESGSSMILSNATAAGIVDAKNTATNTNGTYNNIFIGGAVGRYRTSAVMQSVDVYTTLKINATSTSTANTPVYICGGIIGQMSYGGFNKCYFKGKIEFSENYSVTTRTIIGGLVGGIGLLWGNGAWIETGLTPIVAGPVTVSNSTAYGDISFKNKSIGTCVLGGVCGATNGSNGSSAVRQYYITFDNCEYRDGLIHVESKQGGNIGGFVGEINDTLFKNNCRTFAGSIEVIVISTTTDNFAVGGFIGLARSDITGCSSSSPIEIIIKRTDVTSSSNIWAGGFAGIFANGKEGYSGNPTISNCYSHGSVSVNVDYPNSFNLHAGGFAGIMEGTARIINSYALGYVSVDKINTGSGTVNVYAGGFIGYMGMTSGNGYAMERCFSKGSVTAMANGTSSTNVYAGGLVGNKTANGYIRDSVALGTFITVKGGSFRYCGRICNVDSNLSNNYAPSSMTLFPIESYSANSGTATVPTSDKDKKDGETVSDSLFYSQNIWTNTLKFNTPITGRTNYTDVSDQPWSFSGIGSRGYPLLIGSDGKLLEGQQ